ncbi:hypothetical protein BGX38DRAFT_1193941 [Terfezia claveryi]|nr:hypothetical protein BGX38DRAFT_1193941 [Terfezia claveryi]
MTFQLTRAVQLTFYEFGSSTASLKQTAFSNAVLRTAQHCAMLTLLLHSKTPRPIPIPIPWAGEG